MMTFKAFHGDEAVKNKYIDRVKSHAQADEIVKGIYWEKGKGCAVGCTIHSRDYSQYEIELGIPRWLAEVEDVIFEGLPNEKAKEFPLKFLNSINIGSNLEKIKIPFLILIVESVLDKFDHEKFPSVFNSINSLLNFLKKEDPDKEKLLNTADAYASDAVRDAADYADYADYDASAAAYAASYVAYAARAASGSPDYYAAAAASAARAAASYAASAITASPAMAASAYTAGDYAARAASAAAASSAASSAARGYADAASYDAYSKFEDKLIELIVNCKTKINERLGAHGEAQ